MGYIRHHVIVVTGHRWTFEGDHDHTHTEIDAAWKAAKDAGCIVSEIVASPINSYFSFFCAPDGSKEGWANSDEGDAARDEFIAWLREHSTEGEGWFSWAEVVLGSDDAEAHIERHAWDADEVKG